MSLNWSNEETFKFIELYQAEPAIWDPKNELHKDRKKVNYAWCRIEESLRIPVTELKKKKETLMSAFRLHYKKKRDSIRSGEKEEDIYKPIWLYYDAMEAFLNGIYECRNNTSIGVSTSPVGRDAVFSSTRRRKETRSNSSGSKTKIKYKEIKIPVQKRHAIKPYDSENERTNALSAFNKAANNKEQKVEDECELYGRLLANKLRRYTESERQEIMYEIDGLLLRRRRNYSPHYVSAGSSYACPSPSSPYSIKRPLSSNSTHS